MLDYLIKEDLPQSLEHIADVIGIDTVKALVRITGGGSVYLPSENSLCKSIRNRIIKDEFCGNYKELATRFGITENQVRNIVAYKN